MSSPQNNLEMALLRLYPQISDFKNYYDNQGLELHLSGSGATYFSFNDIKYKPNENYLEIKCKTM